MKPIQPEPTSLILLRDYIDLHITYRLTGFREYTESLPSAQREAERAWEVFIAALRQRRIDETGQGT